MEKTKLEQLMLLVIKLKDYAKSSNSIISLQDSLIKELTKDLEKSKLDNKKQFSLGIYTGIAVFVITQTIINLIIT